jgi:hypothetical protein
MFFFDDQMTNIRDVQTAFPRSTCVLIDPRPVKKDLREFQGNPYPLETMYRGFHKEHMALVDEFTETLVFDWDKTLSVVEGIHMPKLQSFEDTGIRLEDVCHVILGGHARIALLKSFFKRIKATIIILTNNPAACPISEIPFVIGDDPTCYNKPQFLRLIRFIIPSFQERNLIASHMYGGIKSEALKDYFSRKGGRRTRKTRLFRL